MWIDSGRKIKELREKMGKTQERVCQDAAWPYDLRTYQRIEGGTSRPRREKLIQILAKALQVANTSVVNSILTDYGFATLRDTECQEYKFTSPTLELQAAQNIVVSFTPPSLLVPQNGSMVTETDKIAPQEVKWQAKWAPDVEEETGIIIGLNSSRFIPWKQIQEELIKRLLPNVRMVPIGSTVELGEYNRRKDWIIRVINPDGVEIANIWIGGDPLKGYAYDGLVRIGVPSEDKTVLPTVWQVFQRYSNGTYVRVDNPYDNGMLKRAA
ncbi:MAG TPA: helix-turn-helix transcriptional regulator [Terriglobia bacterium]|jgi:transcriptional regulator with XRE-family HTH domain